MPMTLSVVPVRFEYACGHTALTSLPRVRAESPAQRIVRISQEKAAAGQRACDFCPPISSSSMGSSDLDGVGRLTVALAPPAIAPSMIDGIDNPPLEHAVAGEQVPEQEQEEAMTTTTEPVSEPATARDERPATPETTPAPTLPKGVFPLRKLTDEQEHEVIRLYADTTTPLVEIGRRFGIGQTSVARIAQRRGALLRSPTISRAMASDRPGPAAADTGPALERETTPVQPEPVVSEPVEPEPAAQPTGAPTVARGPRSVTSRQRRPAPVARRPRAHAPVKAALISSAPVSTATRRRRSGAGVAGASVFRQFVVTFTAEQVLEASSALDALQQVQARGATEVTAIIRIA
jgi:hypothetical protein